MFYKINDTSFIIYDMIKQNKYVVFEGAQSSMLDLDFGTYPIFLASETTFSRNVAESIKVSFTTMFVL